MFKVEVTVTNKRNLQTIWNKVHLVLDGDKNCLFNLQNQLDEVKADVNADVNKAGLALSDVDVMIVLLNDPRDNEASRSYIFRTQQVGRAMRGSVV